MSHMGRPVMRHDEDVELVRIVIQLRTQGLSWPQVGRRLGLSYFKLDALRHRNNLFFQVKKANNQQERHVLPAGVSTLPPLPSLQLPMPVIEGE